MVMEVSLLFALLAYCVMLTNTVALTFRSAEALVQMMEDGEVPDWFPSAFAASRIPNFGYA